jgi:VanZ family protein
LVLRAFRVSTDFSKKRIYIFSIIFSTFYALLDEIHQYFVPGRHFAITDLLIDFVGVIAGLILWDKIFNKTLKI